MLTAEQIKGKIDRPSKLVPVPEWGGDVMLKAFSGRERDRFDAWKSSLGGAKSGDSADNDDDEKKSYWLWGAVILHMTNEDGSRVYTFDKISELTQVVTDYIENRSASVLERLFPVCDSLSFLTVGSLQKKSDG